MERRQWSGMVSKPLPPVKQPIRRLPVALKKVVNAEVDKMLNDNVIQLSSSAWSSQVVLVNKKDQSLRFYIDFRKLNELQGMMPTLYHILTIPWIT